MGVGQSSNAQFYGINQGKICRTFKEPIAGVTKTLVHEAFYDYIDGQIADISTHTLKFNDSVTEYWSITLLDGEQKQVLQIPKDSGFANAFLRILPNVDFTSHVKISPSVKIEGDKKKSSVFIMQHGKALKHYFTKDNPNGLPPMTKVKFKGKDTWDDTEQRQFFEEMIRDEIMPKIRAALGKKAGGVDMSHAPVIMPIGEEAEEDKNEMPF
jgi:hypothetical protein